jgi:hypothetical protein
MMQTELGSRRPRKTPTIHAHRGMAHIVWSNLCTVRCLDVGYGLGPEYVFGAGYAPFTRSTTMLVATWP